MPRFMCQETFNMCAVSAAKMSEESGKSIAEISMLLAEEYGKHLPDTNLADDIKKAAEAVYSYISEAMPSGTTIGGLTQLQYCIDKYNPDGTKKGFRLLKGALFSNPKSQRNNKVISCIANIVTFYTLSSNGSIPPAPAGWSL